MLSRCCPQCRRSDFLSEVTKVCICHQVGYSHVQILYNISAAQTAPPTPPSTDDTSMNTLPPTTAIRPRAPLSLALPLLALLLPGGTLAEPELPTEAKVLKPEPELLRPVPMFGCAMVIVGKELMDDPAAVADWVGAGEAEPDEDEVSS